MRRKKKKFKKVVEIKETQILKETLVKISYLLALGFGEAGSEVIS